MPTDSNLLAIFKYDFFYRLILLNIFFFSFLCL